MGTMEQTVKQLLEDKHLLLATLADIHRYLRDGGTITAETVDVFCGEGKADPDPDWQMTVLDEVGAVLEDMNAEEFFKAAHAK